MTGGNFLRQDKILGPLTEVCGTCGSGPSPTGYHFLQANQTALWICSTSPHRLLWQRKPSQELQVSSTLTAIVQTIALACDSNPMKVVGLEPLLPCLQVMLDGYRKVDLPTHKKLPVQADVPELLDETAYQPGKPRNNRQRRI